MKIKLQVIGGDDVAKRLLSYGEKGREALLTAINSTSINATSEAREAETAVATNRLRSSIHFETKRNNQYRYVDDNGKNFDGNFALKAGNLQSLIGTNVNYAAAVESRLNFMNHAKVYSSYEFPAQCVVVLKKIRIKK